MNIKMYPSFDEVFATKDLQGIFYPLCSVGNNELKNLHFVSSNGLWINEDFATKQNTFVYTMFSVVNGKYEFNGDIRLYKGFEDAKKIFPALEKDFEINGKEYLTKKVKTKDYISGIAKILPVQISKDLDLKYYLQSFYEYSINKLNYTLNGNFGEFRYVIDGWGKHESPIVYTNDENRIEETGMADLVKDYLYMGTTIGYEFFTDGNDSVLFFNPKDNSVLSINSYS
ncbi:hypothetical protein FACS189430_03950 [Bacteroidia bacterium]|nr:hypothetical protein FACS189430_03950 [Bacteroidia bacterium]